MKLMKDIIREDVKTWEQVIVGFGNYKYESGRGKWGRLICYNRKNIFYLLIFSVVMLSLKRDLTILFLNKIFLF
jgi:hypothetical protein